MSEAQDYYWRRYRYTKHTRSMTMSYSYATRPFLWRLMNKNTAFLAFLVERNGPQPETPVVSRLIMLLWTGSRLTHSLYTHAHHRPDPIYDQGYGRGGTRVFSGVSEPVARVALFPTDENGLGSCFGAA